MTKREEQWLLRGYKPTQFKAADSVYKLRFADAAVFFINNLIHSRGEWHRKPFLLLDWQERIIRDVFGIVHKRTHRRQFRTAYVEVPKKNGRVGSIRAAKRHCSPSQIRTCSFPAYGSSIKSSETNRQPYHDKSWVLQGDCIPGNAHTSPMSNVADCGDLRFCTASCESSS